jgi:hypothetical protein
MGKIKSAKVNTPQVRLQDYFWVIGGVPKAGKTSLAAKLAQYYFKDLEKVHLFGFEKGYQALRIKASDVDDWDDFEEQVDELVEEKDELGIEFVVIDTADIMHEMATQKVIDEWNAANSSKRTKDIGGVGAKGKSNQGFGAGYPLVKKKVRGALDKLFKAGYGIMVLTHSKDKTVEQKDGTEFDQLTLSLSNSAGEIFINMADFIVFITIEKTKVKDEVIEKRYMYFRSDGYVTAGSRFQHVPNKVEYDVKNFVEVFENAVKAEFEDGFDIDQLRKEQEAKREAAAKEFIEEYKKGDSAEELIAKIDEIAKSVPKTDKSVRDKISETFKEILGGTANYKEVEDVELLQKCVQAIEEIVG